MTFLMVPPKDRIAQQSCSYPQDLCNDRSQTCIRKNEMIVILKRLGPYVQGKFDVPKGS
jgi:hypothetical protein